MAKAGVRDIKRRIRAVTSTQQITRAMKMVAAAKLRRAQVKVEAARPYARSLNELLYRLVSIQTRGSSLHPFLEERKVEKVGYLVVTGDRGLCGSYNINVLRLASQTISSSPNQVQVAAVGKKGRDFFLRRGRELLFAELGLEEPDFSQAAWIARRLVDYFLDGTLDEVSVVYTKFISALQQVPTVKRLFPLRVPAGAEDKGRVTSEYIFEPSVSEVVDRLLPRYVETQVYHALLESKASEHAARMTAMGAATDNAAEMIESLTLQFNRARQASITKEIAEIVGGAEALRT